MSSDTAGHHPTDLHLTGERTAPGVAEENYWFRRHEAAYQALLPHCVDETVLETGCGEGYGAAMIARHAAQVIAIDYDTRTTDHVAYHYPETHPVQANLAGLPIATGRIGVVANLQVIEHLWDQEEFLAECHRVLSPGGKILVTTPNRLTFTPDSPTPLNPFHTRELSPSEMRDLLQQTGFTVELLHGLHHGPELQKLDERYGGSLIDAQVEVVLGQLPGQASWPEDLLADVASVRADDFVVHGDHLDASLDLVAVAVRS